MKAPRDLFNLARLNQPDWLFVHDDFNQTLDSNRWATVKDSGASAAVGSDAAMGTLVLSSAATTNDDGALVQSAQEFVLPAANKRFAAEIRVKFSDADQHDFFFGFSQKAATNPENILTASNRIGFQINDEDASILCKSEAADVETSKDSESDAADDTYVVLGVSYDGNGRLTYYVNQSPVAAIETNIPATELAVAYFNLSGNNSGTHTSTADYITYCVER